MKKICNVLLTILVSLPTIRLQLRQVNDPSDSGCPEVLVENIKNDYKYNL